MSLELLQRALDALDYEFESEIFRNLCRDVRAELQRPEPVECGWIDTRHGILYNRWMTDNLGTGKYRLLAEKIQDD